MMSSVQRMVIRITSYQLDIVNYRCPADQEGGRTPVLLAMSPALIAGHAAAVFKPVALWIGTTNTRHRDRLQTKQLERIGEDKLVGDVVDAVHITAISQYRQ